MSYQTRITRLGLFFLCLGLAAVAMVFYRMLWQHNELRQTMFIDQEMVTLVQELGREGVITPAEDGVSIDIDLLRQTVPKAGIREYIVNRKQYMYFAENELEIDPAAVSVSNRRLLRDSVLLDRGRILDREGQVLARTTRTSTGSLAREYPLGPAALPLLGIAHPVYGEKSLELILSPYLAGQTEDGLFSWTYRFLAGKKKKRDVYLTIDADLQKKAFEAMQNRTGAVVVLDVRSGDILAAVSTPSFDPAQPPGLVWDDAAKLGYKGPFKNRAFERRYPPGSTFKLVTATAWLENGESDKKVHVACKGRHPEYGIRDFHDKRHGDIDLDKALAESCNVFFADIGVSLGPSLAEYAEKFGFNRPWTLGIKNQGERLVLKSRAFWDRPGRALTGNWQPIDFKRNPKVVAQGGVGQNVVEATPLQVAMLGAALANDGELVAPRIIKDVRFADVTEPEKTGGPLFSFTDAEPESQVCDKKTARRILAMMGRVLTEGTGNGLNRIYRDGDAYRAGINLPKGAENLLAGKTGTAEAGRGRADHSWFLAVAPLGKPRYAVAVIVEHGGLGAKVAGPVAVDVMLAALNRK